MAWIPANQEIADHPKRRMLSRHLGINTNETIGLLMQLWWWTLSYSQEGDLSRFKPQSIADGCGWEGDPDTLIEALTGCGYEDGTGFLDRLEDGRLVVHDWDDYAGRLVDKRKANAERQQKSRDRLRPPGNSDTVTHTSPVRNAHVFDCSNATEHNTTEQNTTEYENNHHVLNHVANPASASPDGDASNDGSTDTDLLLEGASSMVEESPPYCLASRLRELILKNRPNARVPSRLDHWSVEMARAIKGRDPTEVALVLDWCQADQFWRTNILSPKKFGVQYDRLALQMASGSVKTNGRTHSIEGKPVKELGVYGRYIEKNSLSFNCDFPAVDVSSLP